MQISTRTLWWLRNTVKLVEPIKLGGSTRWRLEEVQQWIAAGCPVPDAEESQRRQDSDFLRYEDSSGRYADFHSNRHTFITNLGWVGVSPKTTQELARHWHR